MPTKKRPKKIGKKHLSADARDFRAIDRNAADTRRRVVALQRRDKAGRSTGMAGNFSDPKSPRSALGHLRVLAEALDGSGSRHVDFRVKIERIPHRSPPEYMIAFEGPVSGPGEHAPYAPLPGETPVRRSVPFEWLGKPGPLSLQRSSRYHYLLDERGAENLADQVTDWIHAHNAWLAAPQPVVLAVRPAGYMQPGISVLTASTGLGPHHVVRTVGIGKTSTVKGWLKKAPKAMPEGAPYEAWYERVILPHARDTRVAQVSSFYWADEGKAQTGRCAGRQRRGRSAGAYRSAPDTSPKSEPVPRGYEVVMVHPDRAIVRREAEKLSAATVKVTILEAPEGYKIAVPEYFAAQARVVIDGVRMRGRLTSSKRDLGRSVGAFLTGAVVGAGGMHLAMGGRGHGAAKGGLIGAPRGTGKGHYALFFKPDGKFYDFAGPFRTKNEAELEADEMGSTTKHFHDVPHNFRPTAATAGHGDFSSGHASGRSRRTKGRTSGSAKWHVFHADSERDALMLANFLMRKYPTTHVDRMGSTLHTKLTNEQVLEAAEKLGLIVMTSSTAALNRPKGFSAQWTEADEKRWLSEGELDAPRFDKPLSERADAKRYDREIARQRRR